MDIFTEGINNISKKFTETNKNVSPIMIPIIEDKNIAKNIDLLK